MTIKNLFTNLFKKGADSTVEEASPAAITQPDAGSQEAATPVEDRVSTGDTETEAGGKGEASQDTPPAEQLIGGSSDAPPNSPARPWLHPPGSDMLQRKEENEIAILFWVARFGWLITAQIVILVWRRQSAKRMAQMTLARLINSGYLEDRTLPNAIPAYVLTRKGAERVRNETGYPAHSTNRLYPQAVWKTHHEKLSISDYFHRACCNWIAIYQFINPLEDGVNIFKHLWTEHEIRQGLGNPPPPPTNEFGKLPDLIFLHANKENPEDAWIVLVEVETSRRRRGGDRERNDWKTIGRFVLENSRYYFEAPVHSPYPLGGILFVALDQRLINEVVSAVVAMSKILAEGPSQYQDLKRETMFAGGTLYRLANMNRKLTWGGWQTDSYQRLVELLPDIRQRK